MLPLALTLHYALLSSVPLQVSLRYLLRKHMKKRKYESVMSVYVSVFADLDSPSYLSIGTFFCQALLNLKAYSIEKKKRKDESYA